MVIDLRGRGRRAVTGLLLLLGLALAVRGAGEIAREARATVAPPAVPIRRVARQDKVVALTFEAVWDGEEAEAVGAALLSARLPATVFASGRWLSGHERLARELAAAGVEFGSATESYPHLDALSPEGQEQEVRQGHARLERLLGRKSTLFRPPHGELTPAAAAAAQAVGCRIVSWSVDALDGRNPPAGFVVARVGQGLRPGAIVRLTTAGRDTARAVPLVSRLLAERGYRAVALSDLLLSENSYVDRQSGEQRPLPGSGPGERPVLSEWWERWRHGVRRGVTLGGRAMEGLLPAEVEREALELARRANRKAEPARWDGERQTVVPERPGLRVDVARTVEAVLRAPAGTDVQPVVEVERSRVVKAMFAPVYRGQGAERRAALMFNVAWGNEVLPELLDRLDRNRVKATFFVEGRWAARFPELLQEIARRGHCLGSHAFEHLDYRGREKTDLAWSLRRTEEAVREAGGALAPLFAPPAGAVSPEMVRTAAELGYWTILWTADSIDWQRPAPEVIQERVQRKMVPGALVLMHPTAPTVAALPGLVAGLRRDGYRLVTVPEVLPSEVDCAALAPP